MSDSYEFLEAHFERIRQENADAKDLRIAQLEQQLAEAEATRQQLEQEKASDAWHSGWRVAVTERDEARRAATELLTALSLAKDDLAIERAGIQEAEATRRSLDARIEKVCDDENARYLREANEEEGVRNTYEVHACRKAAHAVRMLKESLLAESDPERARKGTDGPD